MTIEKLRAKKAAFGATYMVSIWFLKNSHLAFGSTHQGDTMLDKRFKHREKDVKEFYLFIKHKDSHIYYVKFRVGDGFRLCSTGETDIKKAKIRAYEIIQSYQTFGYNDKSFKVSNVGKVITDYYQLGKDGELNPYLLFDMKQGIKYSLNLINNNNFACKVMASKLEDVKEWEGLTRLRIVKLQEQLAADNLSSSSIAHYMAALKKIVNQMIIKGVIINNPFNGVKRYTGKQTERMCFPLDSFKGVLEPSNVLYWNMATIALTTGMRKGEIKGVKLEDFTKTQFGYLLKVNGTKTANAKRTIPVPEITYKCYEIVGDRLKRISDQAWKECVKYVGRHLGFTMEYIEEQHIVFHSFRKMYKTCITQANINESLTEYLMGHAIKNQASKDTRKTYFVEESADFQKLYNIVIDAVNYFIKGAKND